MSNLQFANNAATTLASGITSTATSLTVAAGTGSLFPAITGSQYFYLTLIDSATGTQIEIVKVTAVSTDTFTIVRAQDGTTAKTYAAGDKAELRLIRAVLNDMPKLDESNTFSQPQSMASLSLTSPLPITSGGTGASTAGTVAGTGISVSGTFPNQTVNNTGVTSITAGTGISVSSSTGGVTVTNTSPGVTYTAGTGISISGTTISNTGVLNNGGTYSINITGSSGSAGSISSNGGLQNMTGLNIGSLICAWLNIPINTNLGTININSGISGGYLTYVYRFVYTLVTSYPSCYYTYEGQNSTLPGSWRYLGGSGNANAAQSAAAQLWVRYA